MSDVVLSVIPADPDWQPERYVAFRAVAVAAGLVPEAEHTDIKVRWHDTAARFGGRFARFEIAIVNPERDVFTDQELTGFGDALGQPVCQVLRPASPLPGGRSTR